VLIIYWLLQLLEMRRKESPPDMQYVMAWDCGVHMHYTRACRYSDKKKGEKGYLN
jgi:hypothetical protein